MSLITAAEAALVQLKIEHEVANGICGSDVVCLGPSVCPTAAAIANLEVEIARAKREDLGHLSGRTEIPETAAVLPASTQPEDAPPPQYIISKASQIVDDFSNCWVYLPDAAKDALHGFIVVEMMDVAERASAKLRTEPPASAGSLPATPGTQDDPEFQAVSGFDPKEHLPVMINPPA